MDSLSFPSRPLQKPRCPSIESATYFVRSFFFFFLFPLFFFFLFLLLFLPSCPVLSVPHSLVFHFKNFLFYLDYLAFLRRKAPEFDSTEIQKILTPPLPSPPISRSRRAALSSIARCPVRMTDLNDRLTLINYSYRQL